jgi:hypothetical protein
MKIKMKLAKKTKNYYRYERTDGGIGNIYVPLEATKTPKEEVEFDFPIEGGT